MQAYKTGVKQMIQNTFFSKFSGKLGRQLSRLSVKTVDLN